MEIGTTQMTFKQFVMQKLSAEQFASIHELLKTSKNQVSWIWESPEICKADLVEAFAKLLDTTPLDLLLKWKLGWEKVTQDIRSEWELGKNSYAMEMALKKTGGQK